MTVIERRIEIKSTDLLFLSFEAIDELLLRAPVIFESEDQFLRLILRLGSDYRFLL